MLFPNARNSLRRWSEHRNKIPVPVAVTLSNLMADQQTTTPTSKWFRPEHASSLLRPIRLQIVVTLEVENGDDTEKELFSSLPSGLSTSVHPRWEHLDERMDFSSSDESFRSMKLRFLVEEDGSNEEENSSNNRRKSPIVLLEVPAHPSLLQRLTEVPESLPPNSCLIYFSDGSSRVTPVLFQTLVDGKLTEHPPSSDLEDFLRFEDDVFRTLDGVTPQKARERITSVSRLLLSEEERQQQQSPPSQSHYSAVQDGSSTSDGSPRSSERKVNETTNMERFSTPEGSVFRTNDLDATLEDLLEEEKYLESMLTLEEALMEQELQALNKQKEMVTSGLSEAKQIHQEILLLQGEIQKQSEQLEHDEFRKEAQCIKLVRELGAIYPISVVDGREESGKNSSGIGGESRRYLIRGLEIPIDLYNNSTNVVEEEISAALGFCCHLVVMLGKYLCVPLRYRIFCNSSRSAIRQGTIIYPLFTARVVEREQLERGMLLLYANVDCILQTRGIEYNPKSHILARLQRIYRHVIEGNHPHRTLLPE